MHRRGFGRIGPALALAALLVLAALVLTIPALFSTADDDVCVGKSPAGYSGTTQEMAIWPTGTNCRFTTSDGASTEVFVGQGAWLPATQVALVILAAVVVLLALALTLRDRRRAAAI